MKEISGNSNLTDSRHLAFFDNKTLKKIEKGGADLIGFLGIFKPVPQTDFNNFHNYFTTLFLNNTTPIILNFKAPSFLIYDKFNDFQHYLSVRNPLTTQPASGTTPEMKLENRIRIYPAINSNKEFYVVLISERQELTPSPALYPTTDRSVYYSIKDDEFDMIPKNEMQLAEDDIINFQTIWENISDPSNPTYQFAKLKSFTYTITEYDQLLSDQFPFWNWRTYQTDPSPKRMVKVFPIVVADDPQKVSFKLVFLPYTRRNIGGDILDTTRGFFDNMDVCPDKCPTNSIEL